MHWTWWEPADLLYTSTSTFRLQSEYGGEVFCCLSLHVFFICCHLFHHSLLLWLYTVSPLPLFLRFHSLSAVSFSFFEVGFLFLFISISFLSSSFCFPLSPCLPVDTEWLLTDASVQQVINQSSFFLPTRHWGRHSRRPWHVLGGSHPLPHLPSPPHASTHRCMKPVSTTEYVRPSSAFDSTASTSTNPFQNIKQVSSVTFNHTLNLCFYIFMNLNRFYKCCRFALLPQLS